ncbi:MAG: polyphenol oxidase [Rhodospirillaceae bacterium]|nr:polyphenol oxidase [Rhodospirillaceae bacterium]|tara:strand:+ start:14255 stop:15028 length:774 start_codon:yes stop_codon:yes gene_type:complete
MLKPIQHPKLKLPKINHGFFTREGGVSKGVYNSLNCGIGSRDFPEAVEENRKRAMHFFNLNNDSLVTSWQTHSNIALKIETQKYQSKDLKCDALVTNKPDIALGILTADCAPILLANYKCGVIAAAHAGWRGALSGIIESTIGLMAELGANPENTNAVIGPTIGPKSYEVGNEFRNLFIENNDNNAFFFKKSSQTNFWMFDLPSYIIKRLENTGVRVASSLGLDTYAHQNKFFSYRRNCHKGYKDYGRLLSSIVLEL